MIRKKVKVKCPICGYEDESNLIAKEPEDMKVLEDDVVKNYICGTCLNDPTKLKQIRKHLGI
jgi:hypothetical protein